MLTGTYVRTVERSAVPALGADARWDPVTYPAVELLAWHFASEPWAADPEQAVLACTASERGGDG